MSAFATGRPVTLSTTCRSMVPKHSGTSPNSTSTTLVASCTTAPLVPRTVKGVSNDCAFAAAVRVRIDVPVGVTVGGENDAVTPGGSAGTVNATGWLNPLVVSTPTWKLIDP